MAKTPLESTAVPTALSELPLTMRTVVSPDEFAQQLARLDAAGLFGRKVVLSGNVYTVSKDAVENAAEALAKGDRREFALAASAVLVPDTESRPHPLATSFAPLLPVMATNWPVNKMINGVVVLIGESRSGKTTWIAQQQVDLVVRVSEPLEVVDTHPNTIKADDFAYAIGAALAATAAGYTVAVDSLRGMMYGLSGNTMEGGVSAGLFELLTTINNLFASVGGTAIFAVNPMTGSSDKLEVLLSRIEASVAGFLFMRERKLDKYAFRSIDGDRVAGESDLVIEGQPSFTPSEPGVIRHRNMRMWGSEEGSIRDVSAQGLLGEISNPENAPKGETFPTLKF